MSRTDHHAPAWVRTLYSTTATATEHHSYGCHRSDHAPQPSHEVGCDIDTRNGHCYRWDRTNHDTWDRRPSNDMVHDLFTAPERAHVRDALRGALRDYNAYGETDLEPVTRQSRRAAWATGSCWCCI